METGLMMSWQLGNTSAQQESMFKRDTSWKIHHFTLSEEIFTIKKPGKLDKLLSLFYTADIVMNPSWLLIGGVSL